MKYAWRNVLINCALYFVPARFINGKEQECKWVMKDAMNAEAAGLAAPIKILNGNIRKEATASFSGWRNGRSARKSGCCFSRFFACVRHDMIWKGRAHYVLMAENIKIQLMTLPWFNKPFYDSKASFFEKFNKTAAPRLITLFRKYKKFYARDCYKRRINPAIGGKFAFRSV